MIMAELRFLQAVSTRFTTLPFTSMQLSLYKRFFTRPFGSMTLRTASAYGFSPAVNTMTSYHSHTASKNLSRYGRL